MNHTAKSNPVEDELDAIRSKLYEQTKDMTSQEQVAFFNNLAREGMARHGIKAQYGELPPARRQA